MMGDLEVNGYGYFAVPCTGTGSLIAGASSIPSLSIPTNGYETGTSGITIAGNGFGGGRNSVHVCLFLGDGLVAVCPPMGDGDGEDDCFWLAHLGGAAYAEDNS